MSAGRLSLPVDALSEAGQEALAWMTSGGVRVRFGFVLFC